MKALKITLDHGRVWTAETSDGKRATGATLQSVVEQMVPLANVNLFKPEDYDVLRAVFDGVRDSGGGQIGSGVSAA